MPTHERRSARFSIDVLTRSSNDEIDYESVTATRIPEPVKLKGCCEWFSNLSTNPGAKGFALLPVVEFGKRFFVLQARPVEPTDLEELTEPVGPGRRPIRIAISMELTLRHCPYCTTLFSDLIAEQTAAFDEAAAAVRHLYRPTSL